MSEPARSLAPDGDLPVYRETLDDVAGLTQLKDLAILAADQITGESGARVSAQSLTDLMRPVLFASPAVVSRTSCASCR